MEKIEEGVVVEYNGKYWGTEYEDGNSRSEGWVLIDEAKISDPRFLTKPEDLTYTGSHYISELKKGKLVKVKRITNITHLFE